jgi:hypothetical protein
MGRDWIDDGDNVDNWTMEELKEIVIKFEKIIQGKVGPGLLVEQFARENEDEDEEGKDQRKDKDGETNGEVRDESKGGEDSKVVVGIPGVVGKAEIG